MVRNNWTPCLEFSDPEQAYISNTNTVRMGPVAAGYYDNRYWTMWKLPMFGCTDGSQVLKEIAGCTKSFPDAYIRYVFFSLPTLVITTRRRRRRSLPPSVQLGRLRCQPPGASRRLLGPPPRQRQGVPDPRQALRLSRFPPPPNGAGFNLRSHFATVFTSFCADSSLFSNNILFFCALP